MFPSNVRKVWSFDTKSDPNSNHAGLVSAINGHITSISKNRILGSRILIRSLQIFENHELRIARTRNKNSGQVVIRLKSHILTKSTVWEYFTKNNQQCKSYLTFNSIMKILKTRQHLHHQNENPTIRYLIHQSTNNN